MKNEITITKEEHTWTSDEKLKRIGYGEWVEEFDLVEFEYLGYQAKVQRVLIREPYAKEEFYFGGHLCAYVKIPYGHPYHHKKYEEMVIQCHHGLTFGGVSDAHWIGFDCGHLYDLIPSTERLMKSKQASGEFNPLSITPVLKKHPLFNPVYRNIEFCINECKVIIEQLIEIQEQCEKEKLSKNP